MLQIAVLAVSLLPAAAASADPPLLFPEIRLQGHVAHGPAPRLELPRGEFELQLTSGCGEYQIATVEVHADPGTPIEDARLSPLEGRSGLLDGTARIYRQDDTTDALLPAEDAYVGEKRAAFPHVVGPSGSFSVVVEVMVRRGALPGLYVATLEVEGRGTAHLPVELRVLPVVLPAIPTTPVLARIDVSDLLRTNEGESPALLLRAYRRAAMLHGVTLLGAMPAPTVRFEAGSGDLVVDFREVDRAAAPLLDGDVETGLAAAAIEVPLPEGLTGIHAARFWVEAAAHLRERGWEDRWVAVVPAWDGLTAGALRRASKRVRIWNGREGGLVAGTSTGETRRIGWTAFEQGAPVIGLPSATAGFARDPWRRGEGRALARDPDALLYPGWPRIVGGEAAIPVESLRLKELRAGLQDLAWLQRIEVAAGREEALEVARQARAERDPSGAQRRLAEALLSKEPPGDDGFRARAGR